MNLLLVFWITCSYGVVFGDVKVTSMDRQHVSAGGDSKVIVTGTGFSTNQTWDGDEQTQGTQTYFVSSTHQYKAEALADETTKTTLLSRTPKMRYGDYNLHLKIDGENADYGTPLEMTVSEGHTPVIQTVDKVEVQPHDTVITVTGTIYTSKTESTQSASGNGVTAQIGRIWLNGGLCNYKNADGILYGVALESDESNNGYIMCKVESSYVGGHNISVILSGEHEVSYGGRSIRANTALSVFGNYKLSTLQAYTTYASEAVTSGSNNGGTEIVVTGQYLDTTTTKITVGGADCVIVSQTDTEIRCSTPVVQTPPSDGVYSGGRGIVFHVYDGRDLDTLNTADASDDSISFTNGDIKVERNGTFAIHANTFFVAPTDGLYKFGATTEDAIMISISTDSSSANLVEYTSAVTMTVGTKYLMEVKAAGTDVVELILFTKILNSQYIEKQTLMAKTETQLIQTNSTVLLEKQRISLAGFKTERENTTGQDSIQHQTFKICTQCSDVNNECNEELTVTYFSRSLSRYFSQGLHVIQTDFNMLPELSGDSLTFEALTGEDINCVLATVHSKRGNIPVSFSTDGEGSTVQETKSKIPASPTYFTLSLNDQPGTYVDVLAYSIENGIKKSIQSLFGVVCPSAIDAGIGSAQYSANFEDEIVPSGELNGEESFCGSYSVKNPSRLFYKNETEEGINPSSLCIAYKGPIRTVVRFNFKYTALDGTKGTEQIWRNLPELTPSANWTQKCIDIRSVLTNGFDFVVYSLKEFRVSREWSSEDDLYVDNVFFGEPNKAYSENLDQYVELRRGSTTTNNIRLTGVEVKQTEGSDNTYDITLTPANCGSDIPTLGLAFATASGNDFSSDDWEAGTKVTTENVQNASPAITGKFGLSYTYGDDGEVNVGEFAMDVEQEELEKYLEAQKHIADVTVERLGLCSGYEWKVKVELPGGDFPSLKLKDVEINGEDAAITVSTTQNGGLKISPLPGDVFRTIHDKPQVALTIEGVPQKCNGACSFEYTDDKTPSITSVVPTDVSAGASVTITGEKFSTTASENVVTIGKSTCEVIEPTTATEISCVVGASAAGVSDVSVNVAGLGLSNTFSSVNVGCTVTSAEAVGGNTVSRTGGNVLVITGSGFGSMDDTSVLVGSAGNCDTQSINNDWIVCHMEYKDHSGASADVAVTVNSVACGTSTITLQDSSASVTSINQNKVSLNDDTNFEIVGTGFGAEQSDSLVLFGSHIVTEYVSWTDTNIVLVKPKLAPGTYNVLVNVSTSGYASSSAVIEYQFSVSGISPNPIPFWNAGGTEITLTGEGFHSDMKILAGEKECTPVGEYTATQAICTVPSSYKTYTVKNTGECLTYGIGFAWSEPYLEIEVGDTVRWEWDVPEFLNLKYSIAMFDSPGDADDKPNDIIEASQFKSGSGNFEYQFTSVGTYYYRSVCVDPDCDITMYGVVKVVLSSPSEFDLMIKSGDYYAISSSSRKRRETGQDDAFSITVTSDDTNAVEITKIDPLNGDHTTEITLTGSGFVDGSTSVKIGTAACDVDLVVTDAQIKCKLNAEGEIKAGYLHEVKVTVTGKSASLAKISKKKDRYFGLYPNVNGLDVTIGSTRGGTKLSITGAGFNNGVTALVGGQPCEILEESTYEKIVCYTPVASALGEVDVKVFAGTAEAKCTESCKFTYTDAMPATISNIASQVTGSTVTLTITGQGFGDDAGNIEITLVDINCAIDGAVTNVQVSCGVNELAPGIYEVLFRLNDFGFIDIGTFTFEAVTTTSPPEQGSTKGAVITFNGYGFDSNSLNCQLDCEAEEQTWKTLTIRIPAQADAVSYSYVVLGVSHAFVYSDAITPTLTVISPQIVSQGETVTIDGTGFGDTSVTVKLANEECTVTSHTDTQIQCTAGAGIGGYSQIKIHVENVGFVNVPDSILFQYEFNVNAASPVEGSYGGGTEIDITGVGFYKETSVSICDQPCEVIKWSSVLIRCKTPPSTSVIDATCAITVVNAADVVVGLAVAFTYKNSATPKVDAIDKTRGGTAGGTTLTITGTQLNNALKVTIDGSECVVQSNTDTQIICVTSAHKGSLKADVVVSTQYGDSISTAEQFFYIDVWSSIYTWGGAEPAAGSLVVIQKNQTVLMDTTKANSKVMKVILIFGKLQFDDEATEELLLQSEYILVMAGGVLEIGTEDKPFENDAKILMHGNLHSKKLPIVGSNVLAVLGGSISLIGKTVFPWTLLAETAVIGQNQIVLKDKTGWKVDNEIIIATTGDHLSQGQTEIASITEVSTDGYTYTLNISLEYEHLGVSETRGGVIVDLRAEVGLLTRNIKFAGASSNTWIEEIEACPEGFDPAEFAKQTCFQGRFGDEIGSDQFGAHMMIHGDEGTVSAKLAFVQFDYVGQAFQMGRYPVHFHLNGNMDGSYARGLSINKSFNRAIVIHGTNNLLVEWNIAHGTMGGTYFIEGGTEVGNVIQYNLAVFTIASTSLQNDDVSPACFWVTNANNIIKHNHGVGSSHFGWWYRQHEHPDGPLFDTSIWPQHVTVGTFYNNTAHSNGWFGLWIFQDFFPTENSEPGGNAVQAVYEKLTAWHCEKGAEWVNVGAINFKDFVMVDNEKAGIEFKFVTSGWKNGQNAVVQNAIISGGDAGIVLPQGKAVSLETITLENMKVGFKLAKIDGTCGFLCGGFEVRVADLNYDGVTSLVKFDHDHDFFLRGVDSSLTGTAGGSIAPFTPIMDPQQCTELADDDQLVKKTAEYNGATCNPSVHMHRFVINNLEPDSLAGEYIEMENLGSADAAAQGTVTLPFREKDATHTKGFTGLLQSGRRYKLSYQHEYFSANFSYTAKIYGLAAGDWIIIEQDMPLPPDGAVMNTIDKNVADDMPDLNVGSSDNFAWYYDVNTKIFSYIVKVDGQASSDFADVDHSFDINLSVYRCYYENCITPETAGAVSPDRHTGEFTEWTEQFLDHPCIVWSNENKVVTISENNAEGSACWVKIKQSLGDIEAEQIIIQGNLVVVDDDVAMTIKAKQIVVNGRLVVGWDDEPFTGKLTITLYGNHDDDTIGPYSLTAKRMGVYGGMDLHGKYIYPNKVTLASTAQTGSTALTLSQEVTWTVGSQVLITTTSFDSAHTEVRTLTGVDGTIITIDEPLSHAHISEEHEFGSFNLPMKATVAILSSNVKIQGDTEDGTVNYGASLIAQGENAWMRVSNIEFKYFGHLGHYTNSDIHSGIAWLDIGLASPDRPSYLVRCAFNEGYSTAIGVLNSHKISISKNVVYRPIDSGIVIEGSHLEVTGNLVAEMRAKFGVPGNNDVTVYENWPGAFDIRVAENLMFKLNIAAGSQSYGFKIFGEKCTVETDEEEAAWLGNVAHGCLHGVHLKKNSATDSCSLVRNFVVWKSFDFGIYMQTSDSIVVKNVVVADSRIGILPIVYAPNPVGWNYADKSVRLEGGLFVGRTHENDCEEMDESLMYMVIRASKGGGGKYNGHGGKGFSAILEAMFIASHNAAPKKKFMNSMSYSAIRGRFDIVGVTFANYVATQCSSRDVVFWTNPSNEDIAHPVYTSDIQKVNVDIDSMVLFNRPSTSVINPSDCVDMECDAKKKYIIKDTDGTFLGTSGTIIPESQFGWDDNNERVRGLGDYRIPKVMLSDTSGHKINADVQFPNKGIAGNAESYCTYKDLWQAFQCSVSTYQMMVIESMDADTETRRLSPVAVAIDDYIDLMNGPQDHGWCAGYTCMKRISLFYPIVQTGKMAKVYFTGTSPHTLRLHFLNVANDDAVVLAIYYSHPQIKTVKLGDASTEIPPSNRRTVGENSFYDQGSIYIPKTTDPVGTNYFDDDASMFYITVKGTEPIIIATTNAVSMKLVFAAVQSGDTFGENVVNYLATFLNIDKSRIIRSNPIAENSRRRKRSTESNEMTITVETDNDGQTEQIQQQIPNLVGDEIDGNTIATVSVIPLIATDEQKAEADADLLAGLSTPVDIGILEGIVVTNVPLDNQERQTFKIQIEAHDDTDSVITGYGVLKEETVTATLSSSSDAEAELQGTKTVSFNEGVATFTDLVITRSGDYQISFTESGSNKSVTSDSITIKKREVSVKLVENDGTLTEGSSFDVKLLLTDEDGNKLEDIDFKGYIWKTIATLDESELLYPETTLSSPTEEIFDVTTSTATVSGLSFTGTHNYNRYNIKFSIWSEPGRVYEFSYIQTVTIYPENSDDYKHIYNENKGLRFYFADEYENLDNDEDTFKTYLHNWFTNQFPQVYFYAIDAKNKKGKLEVDVDVYGDSESNLNAQIEQIYNNMTNVKSLEYKSRMLTFSSYCPLEVDERCYGGEDNNVAADTNWKILAPALVLTILVAIAIIAVTHIIKTKYRSSKIYDSKSSLQRLESPINKFETISELKKPEYSEDYNFGRFE